MNSITHYSLQSAARDTCGFDDEMPVLNGAGGSPKLMVPEAEYVYVTNLEFTDTNEKALEVKSDNCRISVC